MLRRTITDEPAALGGTNLLGGRYRLARTWTFVCQRVPGCSTDPYADIPQFTNCGPPLIASPPTQSRVPSEILQTCDELRRSGCEGVFGGGGHRLERRPICAADHETLTGAGGQQQPPLADGQPER